MTLQERIADTKAQMAAAVEERQALNLALQKSERLFIKLDAELALLEAMEQERALELVS